MKNLTLCDRTVRINDEGMVSLTDMWKASGSNPRHQTYLFLKNDSTKRFIASLEAKQGNACLDKKRGGNESGTWANELLAYKYAGWIDPDFEVGTYEVLRDFFSGALVHKQPGWKDLHDYVVSERCSKKMGSFHGKGLATRRTDILRLRERYQQLMKEFQLELEFQDLI